MRSVSKEVGEVRRRLLISGVVALLLAALAPSARAGTPGTMTITSDTTLTEDHHGSIEIAADDVTLDCAGFSVIGPSPDPWPVDGVLVDQHSGVTVTNCTASGFVNGFKLQGVTDSTLVGNTATANEGNGFYADGSGGNLFRDNIAFDNIIGTGFAFLDSSNDNLLKDSIAFGNGGNGANVYRGDGNRFRGNVMYSNGAFGFAIDRADGSLLVNNVARGNTNAGFISTNSRGSRLVENVARGNSGAGFELGEGARGTHLVGNVARGNHWGFSLDRADENILVNNTARGSEDNGFALGGSSGNVLRANESLRNFRGFFVHLGSNDNIFRRNRANGNHDSAGFGVEGSDGNRFIGNRATGNRRGFYLWFESSHNALIGNVACRNRSIDAHDDGSGVGNIWRANRFCTSDI